MTVGQIVVIDGKTYQVKSVTERGTMVVPVNRYRTK